MFSTLNINLREKCEFAFQESSWTECKWLPGEIKYNFSSSPLLQRSLILLMTSFVCLIFTFNGIIFPFFNLHNWFILFCGSFQMTIISYFAVCKLMGFLICFKVVITSGAVLKVCRRQMLFYQHTLGVRVGAWKRTNWSDCCVWQPSEAPRWKPIKANKVFWSRRRVLPVVEPLKAADALDVFLSPRPALLPGLTAEHAG